MEILLLEPYLVGSHASWAREYAEQSEHRVQLLGLEGRHWKWRMHGGAVTLARQFLALPELPDLILASAMLDLTTFLALTRERSAGIPVALYFHENQLSYPWSPDDADPAHKRDAHYAFINYASALAADAVLFNSDFHRADFLKRLPGFLGSFPDHNEADSVARIAQKCRTLHVGLDLQRLDCLRPAQPSSNSLPLLLWNHRWEYDKNPEDFFRALFILKERGVAFNLAVLGESYRKQPPIFSEAQKRLADQIVHWGYAESFADYAAWLWRADILPVTSVHDFFGISVVEAIYCGCRPLLPGRLAYPEHVPASLQTSCFYADFAELVARLEALCRSENGAHREVLRGHVGRYDWQEQAPIYDRFFAQLSRQR